MRKVFMIGDSLMQDYNAVFYPQFGFGQIIRSFIKEDIIFVNLAKYGRSSKSFYNQNRFSFVEKNIEKGDLLIVSFGSNDENNKDMERYTDKDGEFLKYLSIYNEEAKKKGANIIYITSPTKCIFDEFDKNIDTHKGYPASMYNWCKKNNLFCMELNEETKKIYNYFGYNKMKEFHQIYEKNIYKRYIDGLNDTSHYNLKGATFIALIIIHYLELNYKYFDDYFIDIANATSFNPNLNLEEFNELLKNKII